MALRGHEASWTTGNAGRLGFRRAGEEIALQGKDFADALFSVWLGQHPVDDELKNEMLKNR